MATVSVILRNDKIKKDGTAPLHFLIIKDRRKSKVTTGVFIEPKYWNDEKAVVKPGAPNSARLNSFLKNKLAELQDKVFEHETLSKSLTTKKLKEKIYGKIPTNFFEFSKRVLEGYEKQNMFGTYDKAQSILAKLGKFNGSKSLMFQDIDPNFLDKYDSYCRKEWENKTNTVHKDMKFIRKVFNDAIRLEIVEPQENPFIRYKLKLEKTQRTFLTEDELEEIAKVECTPGTRLELHRDMFIFAAYCGGLRVSDMLQLKWKNMDKTHIHFTIRKTGSQLSIKVPDRALAILEKYKPKKAEKEHYVFSMLQNGLNEKDLRLVDNEISKATAYINKNLKILATKAEIEKPISFHISRHTFATRALRKGISIDKVSKLMGHAAIRETQVYAKIVNEELDKAMDVFN
jgi:integrase/recombinase XerD